MHPLQMLPQIVMVMVFLIWENSGTSPIDKGDYFSHAGTYHDDQFALQFETKSEGLTA